MVRNKIVVCVVLLLTLSFMNANAQKRKHSGYVSKSDSNVHYYRDIYPDTWVGVDGLGRHLPTYQQVGPVKTDHPREVGIFYVTWHTDNAYKLPSPYRADVTKILAAHPEARLNGEDPNWGPYGSYHWGEPWAGYFLSDDPYVIRQDMSMLSNAGVDFLILDVTNAVRYWKQWYTIFGVMEKMKAQGDKVPKICFWAFNGPVITVVQDLYDKIYKPGKYKDLWFYWDGKPLLLYNGSPNADANGTGVKNPNPDYDPAAKTDRSDPHFGDPEYTEKYLTDYTKQVKDSFTLRMMWWGYYKWDGKRFVGTEDNWSFGYDLGDSLVRAMTPDELVSKHDGINEEFAVTPAQHPYWLIGKSWTRKYGEPPLNEYDLPDSGYVPWLNKWVKDPEKYGIYFQERWNEAIKADPEVVYLNDWNELTAGKYAAKSLPANLRINDSTTTFMRRPSNYYFVDQYNAEFNRTIEPMKGGYTDNYYMQMVENIRRYKGVRPIPVLRGYTKIDVDGNFAPWSRVKVGYRDTRGDTFHRNFNGYGGLHYVDTLGRNDIVTSKVAVDNKNVYFYVETAGGLTPSTGHDWMLLFINADKNYNTGWFGYDFLVDKKIINDTTTTLMRYDSAEKAWVEVARLGYRYIGNKLELAVPRRLLGLDGKESFTFDFKWCDNPPNLKNPISLCTAGDTAPDWRFNYRCIWKSK